MSGCGEEGVELDIKVRPRGDNYSTSRGEHYASMVTLGSQSNSGATNGNSVYNRYSVLYCVVNADTMLWMLVERKLVMVNVYFVRTPPSCCHSSIYAQQSNSLFVDIHIEVNSMVNSMVP